MCVPSAARVERHSESPIDDKYHNIRNSIQQMVFGIVIAETMLKTV